MRFHALRLFSLLLLVGPVVSSMLWASTLSPSQTVLHLSSQSVSTGTAVTLTASVTSQGHPVYPGLVKFCNADTKYCEDISILDQAQLTASGTATVKLTLPLGAHSIKAVFQGTNTFATSSSAVDSVTVSGNYPTDTAIIGQIQPPWIEKVYSLTGVVWSSGTQNITGTLNFLDKTNSNAVLAEAQLGQTARGPVNLGLVGTSSNGAGFSNIEAGITVDLNGDGKLDHILPGFQGSSGLSVLLGNGDGTFMQLAPQLIGDAGATPFAITVGDFNNDDIPDVAAAISGSSDLYISLGKGDGTFAKATTVTAPAPSRSLTFITGDFNGDGNVDLAAASDTRLEILLGKGDGTFTPLPEQSISQADQIAVGDFNQDGKADLVAVNSSGPWIVLGNGDGTFTGTPSIDVSFVDASAVAVGDFNRDGKPDFVVSDDGSRDCRTCNVPGKLSIFLGNGDGTFALKSSTPAANLNYAEVGDLNGDGILDVLTVTDDIYATNGTAFPFYGAGDGTISQGSEYNFSTGLPLFGKTFSLGDFNADGKADFIIPGYLDTVLSDVTSTSATVNNIKPTGSVGLHAAFAQYSGDTDNPPSSSGTTPLIVQGGTSINLQVTPQTVARGQTVQFTVTLSPFPSDGYTPTGTITLSSEDGTQIASFAVKQATTTLTTSQLILGRHTITASYGGDTYFLGSTSPGVTLNVSGSGSSATETLLQVLPSSSVEAGSVVTLSAQVTAQGNLLHQGQVLFCDTGAVLCEDTALLGEAQLTENGTATIRLKPGIGLHHIQAIFQNTGQYARSASNTETLTVEGLYPTTTKIYWEQDTLLSAVASYGKYIPSGTVTFQDQTTGSSLGSTHLPGFTTWFTPQKKASLYLGTNQHALAAADFNNDGVPDIASANADGTVSIALGKGDGTFTLKSNSFVATGIDSIAAVDLNRDGIPDLVVSFTKDTYSAMVTTLLGKGDGTFLALPAQTMGFIATPLSTVEAADLNGDGIPDLIVRATAGTYSNIYISLGNGDGTFSGTWNTITVYTSSGVSYIAVGDFNRDGILDIAGTNDSGAIIYWGQGDGTFTAGPQLSLPATPSSIGTGDFNKDGILDLVTTSGSYDSKGNLLNDTVTVSLGKGDGTFTTGSPINMGDKSIPHTILVRDLNGDGAPDIAVLSPPPAGDTSKGAGILTFLFGRGDGTFSKPDPFYNWDYNGIAAADFDGDGVPDLSITNSGTNSVGVLLSAKTTFGYISNVKLPGSGAQSVYASYSGDASHAASRSGNITISPPSK